MKKVERKAVRCGQKPLPDLALFCKYLVREIFIFIGEKSGNLKRDVCATWFIAYLRLCVVSIFALVDSEDQCLPVTVYNMAVGSGFAVGDSVAIPEPFSQETNFTENDQVNWVTIN